MRTNEFAHKKSHKMRSDLSYEIFDHFLATGHILLDKLNPEWGYSVWDGMGKETFLASVLLSIGKSVVCGSVASPECAHWLQVSPTRPQLRTATPAHPQLDTILLLSQSACLARRSAHRLKCFWIGWRKTKTLLFALLFFCAIR